MDSSFIYMTCQPGAERALKQEVAACTDFRFAFSRPGFLTFKTEESARDILHRLPKLHRRLIFARTIGHSLGAIKTGKTDNSSCDIWPFYVENAIENIARPHRVHCWERSDRIPGDQGVEPALSPATLTMHRQLVAQAPENIRLAIGADDPFLPAQSGEIVLDCIAIAPGEWWIGYHHTENDSIEHARWPGGILPLSLPTDAASRAWLKFEEGLRWSNLPLETGARCLDIGAAPGGASQALLARGAEVIGLDPGAIDPVVLAHPLFSHDRHRSNQVKKQAFRRIRWIIADMNVAPTYTLETLEELVTHPEIHVRGLLFTLKLFQWNMAESLPIWMQRVHDWGYNIVAAKQLTFNRQEVMIAALQKPFLR